MRLRASLARVPAPTGPRCTTSVAHFEKGSRQRSTASPVPPTMTASEPSWAPMGPPETGASTTSTPLGAAAAASFSAVSALIVEWMATMVPGAAAVRTSSITAPTCSSSSTITEITSVVSATSAGEPATAAPRSARAAVASGRTSHTTKPSGHPTRWPAMGVPICPSPMKPTAPIRCATARRAPGPGGSGRGEARPTQPARGAPACPRRGCRPSSSR